MIVEILGLNMTVLNALIWAGAVLAKASVFFMIIGGLFWLIVFLLSNSGLVVVER